MNVNIQLLPYQIEALNCESREIAITAGIGSGKSRFGAIWIIHKAIENPGCRMMIAANTFAQLMGATVKTLTACLDEYKIPYKATLSGSRKRIEFNGCLIYLYSLENYDSIRGIEVSFIYLDEAAYGSIEALQVVRGRLRGKGSMNKQMLLTSSPNGFNFFYLEYGQPNLVNKTLIQAATSENIFLPEGYYESLVEAYGGSLESDLAKQELLGQFVNLQAGAIFSHFDRGINVLPCQLDKRYPVYVGCDFNVDNMSATYIQHIGGVFYQCKEVNLTNRDSNTHSLGKQIIQDLTGYAVHLICDSTGGARKTSSSGKTDHQILKDMGLHVMETHNPFIRDRHNTMNLAFFKKQCVIDPSCKKTIIEIETLSNKDNEGKVAHLSVTLGYVIWKLAPLKPKQAKSSTVHM